MIKTRMDGQWKQLCGKIQAKWDKITDDDLKAAAGKRDVIVGKLQERYGFGKESAERRYAEFEATQG